MNTKKQTLLQILILYSAFLCLYIPVFFTDYLFTDESVQLWMYGKKDGFHMFLPQGRWITDVLMEKLFGAVDRISEVKYIRIFSFSGWAISLPIWFFILKDIFTREALPQSFAFLSSLFLLCIPPLSISILWASCLELFIANTAGLMSGYLVYKTLKRIHNRVVVNKWLLLLSIVPGVVSLFTYQNGLGCFFIPFLIHLLSRNRNKRFLIIATVVYFFICALYFLLFKYQMKTLDMHPSERTRFYIHPLKKVLFFLKRPLSSSFHFTLLFDETKWTGYIVGYTVLALLLFFYFFKNKVHSLKTKIITIGIVICILAISYLPSLIIPENFASNRTLLAIKMLAFIFTITIVSETYMQLKLRRFFIKTVFAAFIINAGINIHVLFLDPVKREYRSVRNYIEKNYSPAITSFYFHRPAEDFFIRKYAITRSMDEFGVPSTFFEWTPEFFTKQVIFELTHKRTLSDSLPIQSTLEPLSLPSAMDSSVLIIPVEDIIK